MFRALRRLTLAFLCFTTTAHARDFPRVLVISDIDDTLQMTYLRPWQPDWRGATRQYWNLITGLASSSNVFTGMREIFAALAERQSAFQYVSGAPEFLAPRPRRFLTRNGFPLGDLSVRPNLKITTEEFKVERITQLVAERPEHRLLFFGDNGEQDVPSYARVTHDPTIAARVDGVYIHQLYGREVGVPLQLGQEGFLTAADLAAKLYLAGHLDAEDAGEIISLVLEGMASPWKTQRVLAFPRPLLDAGEVASLEILGERLAAEPRLQDLFNSLLSLLRARVREIAPACGALVTDAGSLSGDVLADR